MLTSLSDGQPSLRRQLPSTPNIEQLKKQAKERLRVIRDSGADATLGQAQLALARDYGFASWRALKSAVEPDLARFTGHFRRDPDVMADSILSFTSAAGQLFVEGVGGGRTLLEQVEPGVFIVKDTGETYRFEGAPGHPARRVVIGEGFKAIEALRTDARALAQAEATFARALADQSRPRTRVDLDPRTLPRYVGAYACRLGHVIEITLSGDRLFASLNGQAPHEMEAERPDYFFFPAMAAQISFRMRGESAEALLVHQYGRVMIHPRASGKAALEFVESVNRRHAEQARPRTPVTLNAAVLKRYAGRYCLDHNTDLIVRVDGDRLFGEFAAQGSFELFAQAEARFFMLEGPWITFVENASGWIDRAVVHQAALDLVMMRERPEPAPGTAILCYDGSTVR